MAVMTTRLARREYASAFEDGLTALEPLLGTSPDTTGGGHPLPDETIEAPAP
jgi:hypothetical protein